MTNGKTWVLVTDSSAARIYEMYKAKFLSAPNRENLTLVNQYSHEKSRELNRDLITDGSGPDFAMRTLPKEHEFEKFAIELHKHLESARAESLFRDLIIIAPSHFMGLLNKRISETQPLERLVSQRIEKDYMHFNENELAGMLVKHF